MSFDTAYLLASFCVSGVGYVLFSYGRKQGRLPQAVTGIVMLVYPYFMSSVGWMLAAGVALLSLMAIAVRMGI